MEAPKVPTGAGDALTGVVTGMHHVAVAVPELAAATPAWEVALGVSASAPEHVPEQGVNVAVLQAGAQRIELVEPAGPSSPISKFLAKRGPGLHHVAFRVDDVAAAIGRLLAKGVRMIDETPQPGAHGCRVAFVHPKATSGVLVELVEDPAR